MIVRSSIGVADYPALVNIWRSFLAAADRDEIHSHLAQDYFPPGPVDWAGASCTPQAGPCNSARMVQVWAMDAEPAHPPGMISSY